ncbi:hypothetical protein [Helicovermis profundi]|uniref:Pilus assembly protein n=1 Tax=Helicovermis profundi TaxID=3065157 RepID=A0AAU9E766_9FIRM|nr:hypothetical protein HLPR_08080 [Clostridia bacterium S502]
MNNKGMITIESVLVFPIILLIVVTFILLINSEFIFSTKVMDINYNLLKSAFEDSNRVKYVKVKETKLKRTAYLEKDVNAFNVNSNKLLIDFIGRKKVIKNTIESRKIRKNIILNRSLLDLIQINE